MDLNNEKNIRDKERLYTLIKLILNNTDLNWNDELLIMNTKTITDYIYAIEPEYYNDRVEILKHKKKQALLDIEQHIPTIE